MPCNLAVSITKAAVQDQKLKALLTPDIVKTLIETYIANREGLKQPQPNASISKRSGTVSLYIQELNCFLTVRNGRVIMDSVERWHEAEANQLAEDIAQLLQQAALKLFDLKITATLKKLGTVSSKSVDVNTQGQKTQATMFTLDM
jgi:hypothetical protein